MTGTILTRCGAALALTLLVFGPPAATPAHAAVEIQEVTSPGGVTAWLVEDYSVPIVSVHFAFRGGSTQDPEGKEGLANLMSGLFDEGAGDLDADAFQERQDEIGAEMRFTASRDALYGQMRMLADDRAEALELLRLAVNSPRFDPEPLERIRAQIVTGIVASSRNPQTRGADALAVALYGDHPYARRTTGTVESVGAVTAEDLHAFHAANFARSNLHVAVVGAIDAETLAGELDELFGGLPQDAELVPVGRVEPRMGEEVRIAFDLPQTTLQLVYPGVERDAPEFFAAYLANHVLGGGTFSSRLFQEVREMRGLAYGIGSYLHTGDHAETLIIATSTRSDRAGETLALVEEVVSGLAEDGPTLEELDAAKTYVIGAYAINNLDSSAAIARTLVELQRQERGIDYIERREALIDAVTLEEVAQAASRLLSAQPTLLVVGPQAGEEPAAD